jgi:nitrate reductase delta subunit
VNQSHAVVHRVAALLLDYPDEDLLGRLPDLRAVVSRIGDPYAGHFRGLLDHLQSAPLVDLAATYVETFDLRRKCCLYLTYFAYGDTRKRGVALLSFKQAYRAAGIELTAAELPDHLCVVLEFAATADGEQGRRLLLEHRAGLEVLRLALLDAGSPYAGAVAAVCATLPRLAGPDREAVAKLAAAGPPAEEVGLEPYGLSPFASPDLTGVRR